MKINIDNLYDHKVSYFWDLVHNDDAVKNDFFELKGTILEVDEAKIQGLLSIADVPVCACHYPGAEIYPWWNRKFNILMSSNCELRNTYNYLMENNLLEYNGKILLETRDELHMFLEKIIPYPEKAHYLDVFLFCCNNIIIHINHHSTIFVYSRLE